MVKKIGSIENPNKKKVKIGNPNKGNFLDYFCAMYINTHSLLNYLIKTF